MARGGYQIIDFKGVALTVAAEAIEIGGVYDRIHQNYGNAKFATLIHGLVVGETAYPDFWAEIELDGSDYKFVSHGTQTVTVSASNMVKVTE